MSRCDSLPTKEIFNRNFRRPEKSTAPRHRRYANRKENVCMKCELPTYEDQFEHERMRKKTNKFQHCPSCNCQSDFNEYERYFEKERTQFFFI